jgi:hypothetical protein
MTQSLRAQYKDQMQNNTAGLLKQIALSQTIDDNTSFCATPGSSDMLVDSGDVLMIEVPGGTISIGKEGREAVKTCLGGKTISVAQLSRWLSAIDRIDLVRRLIAAEIVKVVE